MSSRIDCAQSWLATAHISELNCVARSGPCTSAQTISMSTTPSSVLTRICWKFSNDIKSALSWVPPRSREKVKPSRGHFDEHVGSTDTNASSKTNEFVAD